MKSLSVTNYKCFKQLELNNLAMINVFIGENNCGKTTVLEACRGALGMEHVPILCEHADYWHFINEFIEFGFFADESAQRWKRAGRGEVKKLAIHLYLTDHQFGFIDEIENSLHLSGQIKLFKDILDKVYDRGGQVFITTHSYGVLQSLNTAYQEWLVEKALPADYKHSVPSYKDGSNMYAVYGMQGVGDTQSDTVERLVKRLTPKQFNVLQKYNVEVRDLQEFGEKRDSNPNDMIAVYRLKELDDAPHHVTRLNGEELDIVVSNDVDFRL